MSDLEYLVTFAVMLVVALVIANLVASVRAQTRVAGARERRTSLLYAMSRELAATRSFDNLARVAVKHVAETFASRAAVLLPDAQRSAAVTRRAPELAGSLDARRSLGRPMGVRPRPAGGTRHRHAARGAGPVSAAHGDAAARSACSPCSPTQRRRLLLPEQRHLLETFAGQIALAIERAQRAEEAETARVAAETRELAQHAARVHLARPAHSARGDHGREPRAQRPGRCGSTQRRARNSRARSRPRRSEMSELISNVLDLMSFEVGEVHLRRDWHTLDDLVGSALARLEGRFGDRPVDVVLPAHSAAGATSMGRSSRA